MREVATVARLDGNYAIVSIDKKDECSKCGMCAFPKGADKIEIRAKNGLNAVEGDSVIIERTEGGKLTGAILVFLVPLLLIGLSVLINYLFINKEIWTLYLSAIFIVLWFCVLGLIDKKLSFLDKYCAQIIEIKEKQKENTND